MGKNILHEGTFEDVKSLYLQFDLKFAVPPIDTFPTFPQFKNHS